jgi:hypothetical protein
MSERGGEKQIFYFDAAKVQNGEVLFSRSRSFHPQCVITKKTESDEKRIHCLVARLALFRRISSLVSFALYINILLYSLLSYIVYRSSSSPSSSSHSLYSSFFSNERGKGIK